MRRGDTVGSLGAQPRPAGHHQWVREYTVELTTPVPLAAHGTYARAQACTNDCNLCGPVRDRIRAQNREARRRRKLGISGLARGQAQMAPHGTDVRAAACSDDCLECAPVRARRRQGRHAYYSATRPQEKPVRRRADFERVVDAVLELALRRGV